MRKAVAVQQYYISIHALREEGDWYVVVEPIFSAPISIHALREEGDPAFILFDCIIPPISIHALREEGDQTKILANTSR